jgi:hypothetical protein
LAFKPGTEVYTDNMRGEVIFHDSDFVLLKPGQKAEYKHESLGDPSDKFIFPRRGTYSVSLSWTFCTPTVKPGPNGTVGYTCGVTSALSQPLKVVLLASPSFDLQSNVWTVSVE